MTSPQRSSNRIGKLAAALHSAKVTSGSTHNFYLYPARFSPEIARGVIDLFSEGDDWVLDPFMGGGTSIIEGLMLGRRMLGVDLNALAHFVSSVRTRPLSFADAEAVRGWAAKPSSSGPVAGTSQVLNLPHSVRQFLSGQVAAAEGLRFNRQEAFARCALLRLGQWALDCRDVAAPDRDRLQQKLPALVDDMLAGLDEFVASCGAAGIRKREIPKRRRLFWGDAAVVARGNALDVAQKNIRLVFTSPPYPRVHVLYHRWQVQGRRETPAPYWIAQVPDGYFASHYTGGSRTPTGELRYFSMIRNVFTAIRPHMADDGLVAQLVGFADVKAQMPLYLAAMNDAGFREWTPPSSDRLWRQVPNRKWYARLQGPVDASSELLLFHRPARRGQ
jgi:hypothetical protein